MRTELHDVTRALVFAIERLTAKVASLDPGADMGLILSDTKDAMELAREYDRRMEDSERRTVENRNA